jgi:NTP pyrophosphatase (non-canonical NTP hydrolase)
MVAPDQPQILGLEVPDPSPTVVDGISDLSLHRRRPSALNVRQLSRWADRQIGAIARITGLGRHSEVFLLSQAVKLSEEVGELQAEILGHLKMQRSDKAHHFNTENLAGELADVIMSVAVLSQVLDIDLNQAVQAKMAVVENRMAARIVRTTG